MTKRKQQQQQQHHHHHHHHHHQQQQQQSLQPQRKQTPPPPPPQPKEPAQQLMIDESHSSRNNIIMTPTTDNPVVTAPQRHHQQPQHPQQGYSSSVISLSSDVTRMTTSTTTTTTTATAAATTASVGALPTTILSNNMVMTTQQHYHDDDDDHRRHSYHPTSSSSRSSSSIINSSTIDHHQHHQHHHYCDRNWRLRHDIVDRRKRIWQYIMTHLYETMNIEEIALRYENIMYDGSYSLYDYEDLSNLQERVQHLFDTDNPKTFYHNITSSTSSSSTLSSSSKFQIQHHPLARNSMKRAILSSSISTTDHTNCNKPVPPFCSSGGHHQVELNQPSPILPQQQQQPLPPQQLLLLLPRTPQQLYPQQPSQQQQQHMQPTHVQLQQPQKQRQGIDDNVIFDHINGSYYVMPAYRWLQEDDIDHENVTRAVHDDRYHEKSKDGTSRRDESTSSSTTPVSPAAKRPKYTNDDNNNSSKCYDDDLCIPTAVTLSQRDATDGSYGVKSNTKTQTQTTNQEIMTPSDRCCLLSSQNHGVVVDCHPPSTQQLVAERKVQRLIALYHAACCPHENKEDSDCCPISKYCNDMKQLWIHLETCRNNHCDRKHCYTSRRVLAHYKTCTNTNCRTCQPVRQHIATTASSSSSSSSSTFVTPTTETTVRTAPNHKDDHLNQKQQHINEYQFDRGMPLETQQQQQPQ